MWYKKIAGISVDKMKFMNYENVDSMDSMDRSKKWGGCWKKWKSSVHFWLSVEICYIWYSISRCLLIVLCHDAIYDTAFSHFILRSYIWYSISYNIISRCYIWYSIIILCYIGYNTLDERTLDCFVMCLSERWEKS